ncbi:unnamed protein product [Paramecium pentaurelia]|uniref:Transmembrane protein n=1 Tax=Paramecium pentaurelia TaxID=43138 RepID=A0A8S1WUI8_9CILI|nr:unnamed protein product [Paramecium pentaurelia]
MKRKVATKRNAIFNQNIRTITVKNQEEYMNNLKMQAIRLQIEKIVHLDPLLRSLLNSKPNRKHYARSIYKAQSNRSFIESKIQEGQTQQRAKSSEGSQFGDMCIKFKRLVSRGLFKIKMHVNKIRRRFRRCVIAVCLLLTYFRYYPLLKKCKRFSRPRVSILRCKPLLDKLPILSQMDKTNTIDDSVMSKEPLGFLKKKHFSQGNFDIFIKRPIQQFIMRSNTQTYSQKRICKTEHSQVKSMYHINKKLIHDKMYLKSSSIKILSMS